MKNTIILFGLCFALFGCGSGGGSSGVTTKSLFSVWTRTNQGLTQTLDFTNSTFGTFPMHRTFATGHVCTWDMTLGGNESAGTFASSNSAYVAGTGNGVDPGCNSLNDSGTFRKDGNNLYFCSNGAPSCSGFQ